MRLECLPVDALIPHEQIEPGRLEFAVGWLKSLSRFDSPIWVDAATRVILDGHHRWHAFRILGFSHIPCFLVDYDAPEIEVASRRPDIAVSKGVVLARALSGELYPYKTTRHTFPSVETPAFDLPRTPSGV